LGIAGGEVRAAADSRRARGAF